jgi:ABC-type antimicrobial peptide transport system permease subunit
MAIWKSENDVYTQLYIASAEGKMMTKHHILGQHIFRQTQVRLSMPRRILSCLGVDNYLFKKTWYW